MKRVILYSIPTSPFCRNVREFLSARNISFTEYDVSEEQDRLEEMKQHTRGSTSVPVILINHVSSSETPRVIVGYDPTMLEEEFSSWHVSPSDRMTL